MSTVLPENVGGSAALNSVEWITKNQLCLPGEQKSAFDPSGNNFSRSGKSLNVVCKPSLGLSLRYKGDRGTRLQERRKPSRVNTYPDVTGVLFAFAQG